MERARRDQGGERGQLPEPSNSSASDNGFEDAPRRPIILMRYETRNQGLDMVNESEAKPESKEESRDGASAWKTPATPWPKSETSCVSEGVPSDPDFYRWLALQGRLGGQNKELLSYAGARLGVLHGITEGMTRLMGAGLVPGGVAPEGQNLPSSPVLSPAPSPSIVATPSETRPTPLEASTPMDSSFYSAMQGPASFRKRHIKFILLILVQF